MKVVAFNGSARKNGNTAMLINLVFDELHKHGIETELIQFGGEPLYGCKTCYNCYTSKNCRCIIKDDAVNQYIQKMKEADGVILGSPVYVADVSSSMKAFMDRACLVNRANDSFLKRKVGTAVLAVRRGGAIHAFDTMNHFFMISEMYVVSSSYWNFAFGREIGDVAKDEEGVGTMKVLGENMAWLLKKIHQRN
ncbi:MAG: flavodoxin family protein [Candidatus Omnitrophica bacterium]|nr:flavodoxin family protein [Candidatus Omnitrophota bacterium]